MPVHLFQDAGVLQLWDGQFHTFAGPPSTLPDDKVAAQAIAFDLIVPNIAGAFQSAATIPYSASQFASLYVTNPRMSTLGYLLRSVMDSSAPGADGSHPVSSYMPGVGAWAATTAYTTNQSVCKTGTNTVFACVTGGTSGGGEPAWNTSIGGTTTDGSVTWVCVRNPPIASGMFCPSNGGNFMTLPWDPARRSYLAGLYATRIAAIGVDGGLGDVMGPGILPLTDSTAWDPIRRTVGWTDANWITQTADLAAFLSNSLCVPPSSPLYFFPNGLQDGTSYFATNKLLLAGVFGGGMVENFLRADAASATIGASNPAESKQLDGINMMIDEGQIGHRLLIEDKLWPNAGMTTLAVSKQWLGISLAGYLLGNGEARAAVRHRYAYRHDNKNVTYVAGTDGDGSDNSMRGRHHQLIGKPGSSAASTYCNYFGSADDWLARVNLGDGIETFFTGVIGGNHAAAAKRSAVDGGAWVSGVYYSRRLFTNGLVVLNTTTSAITNLVVTGLSASATYLNIDGTTQTTDSNGTMTVASLAGKTALVLSKQ